jgi:F-type H+-transporting ATPase subunit epsilon
MATTTLELEIVTPQGAALRETVDEVTVPSVAGQFGVLPGHLPVLAALKMGVLTWKQRGTEGACAVGTGFVEVSEDRVSVLTDRFVRKGEVDPVRVRADLQEADEKLHASAGTPEDAEYRALVDDELWCAAQLELHGDPPPPTINFVSAYGQAPDERDQTDAHEAPSLTDEGK